MLPELYPDSHIHRFYVGVNSVPSAGLHSYGPGGSEVAGWQAAAAVFELLFVTAAVAAWRRRTRQPVAA